VFEQCKSSTYMRVQTVRETIYALHTSLDVILLDIGILTHFSFTRNTSQTRRLGFYAHFSDVTAPDVLLCRHEPVF